jgi:hypothetical protein
MVSDNLNSGHFGYTHMKIMNNFFKNSINGTKKQDTISWTKNDLIYLGIPYLGMLGK